MSTDIGRRGFLKLLGVGGAATAAAVVIPSGIGLFSATADKLPGAIPHFVFDASQASPLLSPQTKIWFFEDAAHRGYSGNLDMIAFRNPKSHRANPPSWSPIGESLTYQVDVPLPEGMDPHIAFFMAAEELRDAIDRDIQKIPTTLFERQYEMGILGHNIAVITTVEVPIMAFPKPEKGFYLETQILQYAADPDGVLNRREALSLNGEVPMETPDNITMKYLLHLQEELQRMGMTPQIFQANRRQALFEASKRLGRVRA